MLIFFQSKIRSYKKQIEEAEEIAALNLAKFRQVQGNVQEAQVNIKWVNWLPLI